MRFLRMKPGHGEILLAEGDVEVAEDEQALVDEFRRQLDSGMWAAVPLTGQAGRREAQLVQRFTDVPRDADRVIFFPKAAGGAGSLREQSKAAGGAGSLREQSKAAGGAE